MQETTTGAISCRWPAVRLVVQAKLALLASAPCAWYSILCHFVCLAFHLDLVFTFFSH